MQIKKALIIALTLCLLLAFTGLAVAAGFSDISGHWAQEQINKWADKGLVAGYQDGTFKPNNQISRAEFVAMVNRAFAIDKGSANSSFTDVKPGKWYYQDVTAAKANGYIGGYVDGTFKPDQTITRQEVASILVRLLQISPTTEGLAQFGDASRIPEWAKGSVGAVAEAGLMRGLPDNTFQPLKNITRAEAVVSLDRALEYAPGVQPKPVEEPKPAVQSAVEGTVTINDKAADKVVVRIFKADSYEVLKETKTDINGNYKVDLEAGKYDITAVTNSAVSYTTDVNVAENEIAKIDLGLEDAAIVKGILKDKNNRLVKGATILFTTKPTFITTTNNSGEYTIALPSHKTYTVRVYEPDKKGKAPGIVTNKLTIGSPSTYKVDDLMANFAVTTSSGGGGGGGGGGTTTAQVEKPVADPGPGKVERGTTVELKTATTGATIYYTIDGTTPAEGKEGTLKYIGPIAINSDLTINSIAIKSNMRNSEMATFAYTVEEESPALFVSAINIATSPDVTGDVENDAVVTVTLTTATSGVDIYYTTDGSTPTASSTKYNDGDKPVIKTENTAGETITIKAIGIKAGYKNSAVVEKGIVFKAASISVTEIKVSSNPAKITYYEGESLDLTGLLVELTYSDTSKENVVLSDFATKGITTDPVNEASLTIAEHNDKNIVVSYNDKSAQSSGKLSVMAKSVVNIADVPGVTAPVKEAAPVTAITTTDQYTGTVSWSPTIVGDKFAAGTAYTATITLTPKTGYTLTGVTDNFFTVAGATTVTNAADSGIITAVFPATESSEFAGGDGSEEKPYLVATAEQLDNVRNHLSAYFEQTDDIDLTEYLSVDGAGYNEDNGWEPIGNSTSPFKGSFNGNGKTISNLKIARTSCIGLFGQNEGVIRNVSLSEAIVSGSAYVGGLVGYNYQGAVTDSKVTGSIISSVTGDAYAGGLIGYNYGGQVTGCCSAGSVSAPASDFVGGLIGGNSSYAYVSKSYSTSTVTGGENRTGGLIGLNYRSTINKCFATGNVTGKAYVGGLVGENSGNNAQITNSYATGTVTGTSGNIGGLVGRNFFGPTITNSYATGTVTGTGGLIGGIQSGATVTNSYWDTETTEQTTSAGGTGYSTSAMIMETNSVSIYVDWDFANTWAIEEGVSYPYLQWQGDVNIPYPIYG